MAVYNAQIVTDLSDFTWEWLISEDDTNIIFKNTSETVLLKINKTTGALVNEDGSSIVSDDTYFYFKDASGNTIARIVKATGNFEIKGEILTSQEF
jgi:hypothetical protein